MNVIELKGLTKQYQNFTLDHINLEVPGGSIMGLIGENGAGKSTTIKALLGLIRYEGECRILGQTADGDALNDVGVVLDESVFHDTITPIQVDGMLKHVFSNWDSALYARYMEKFQLPTNQKIKEFSRGMKMKLSIAAALSHHPKVLVLDEATGGLDPVVRSEILDEFRNFVSDEEHGILISSHITSDLEHLADYVTYLHKGTVYVTGEKDEILNRYGMLVCSESELVGVDPDLLVGQRKNQFSCEALVKDRERFSRQYPGLTVEPVTLENIMVFIARGN